MPLSELRLAAGVGTWLLLLPLRLRRRSLPFLLHRLGASAGASKSRYVVSLDRTVQIVGRISRMGLFRSTIFPRPCLRRSLALYRVLKRMGYPVEIHIGVRKEAQDIHAHSWVTLNGKALGESDPLRDFHTIYSYPAA